MVGRLQRELGKRDAFDCLEQEAHLNIMRTADLLQRAVESTVFIPAGLSDVQYNVLRILRGTKTGPGASGLKCSEIAARLINREPDITRLVDRLVKRGYVKRQRDHNDRRVVRISITPAGLAAIKPLDKPLINTHRSALQCLTRTELQRLIRTLERIRESLEDSRMPEPPSRP